MAIGTAAAIIGGAAAIGAAVIGSKSSKKASETQAKSFEQAGDLTAAASLRSAEIQRETAESAMALQAAQFGQTREDLNPWRKVGQRAIVELQALYGLAPRDREQQQEDAYGRFRTSPGYQFRLGEGIRAIDRSAASRGKLFSGGLGRELTRYGQGVASAEFGDYANRLASFAGMGQNAAARIGALGAQNVGQQGNILAASGAGQAGTIQAGAAQQAALMGSSGTARASGYVGQANAITGGLQNLAFAAPGVAGYGAGQGWWGGVDPNTGINWASGR